MGGYNFAARITPDHLRGKWFGDTPFYHILKKLSAHKPVQRRRIKNILQAKVRLKCRKPLPALGQPLVPKRGKEQGGAIFFLRISVPMVNERGRGVHKAPFGEHKRAVAYRGAVGWRVQ